MGRRHHYRKRAKDMIEPDMATFLNLMVVLVPFLLITAVFSRITIVELSLPTSAGGSAPIESSFRVEVIVRSDRLEISNGSAVIASLPKVDDEYDLARLSELVMSLKRTYQDQNEASVLLEPDIEYDYLIQVMDVVRSAEGAADGQEGIARLALFTDISIGDAP